MVRMTARRLHRLNRIARRHDHDRAWFYVALLLWDLAMLVLIAWALKGLM